MNKRNVFIYQYDLYEIDKNIFQFMQGFQILLFLLR